MSEDIFDLLEHPNPKARFQGIKRIAKSKDSSMLDVLAELAADDPDPQVREIAAKAIAYIESGGAPSAVKPKAKLSSVSKAEADRAKDYLDEALSHHISGSKAKAVKSLKRALATNPELEKDHYAISLIESITELSGDDAMDLVLDEQRHKEIAKSEKLSSKQKFRDAHLQAADKFTWGSVTLDLIIYTLIVSIGTFLLTLIIVQSAEGLAASYQTGELGYTLETQGLEALPEVFSVPLMLIASSVTGVIALVSLLAWFVAVHIIARLFAGHGPLPYLIYNITSYYNSRIPIVFLLMYLMVAVTAMPDIAIAGWLINGLIVLLNFMILFGTFGLIGKTYDVSALSGCFINFIASLVLGVVGAAIQVFFLDTFIGFLENFLA